MKSNPRRKSQKTREILVHKDYQHRDVVDKLGIRPGHAVAFAVEAKEVDAALCQRVLAQAGRPAAVADEAIDVVLAVVDDATDASEVLKRWKLCLKPEGSIWLLSAKHGQPGYVDQQELIAAGLQAGLVDNKICSISTTTGAMRFVIRKKDRTAAPSQHS